RFARERKDYGQLFGASDSQTPEEVNRQAGERGVEQDVECTNSGPHTELRGVSRGTGSRRDGKGKWFIEPRALTTDLIDTLACEESPGFRWWALKQYRNQRSNYPHAVESDYTLYQTPWKRLMC